MGKPKRNAPGKPGRTPFVLKLLLAAEQESRIMAECAGILLMRSLVDREELRQHAGNMPQREELIAKARDSLRRLQAFRALAEIEAARKGVTGPQMFGQVEVTRDGLTLWSLLNGSPATCAFIPVFEHATGQRVAPEYGPTDDELRAVARLLDSDRPR